jgi:casein kinase I family protein HRR25
MIRVDAIPHSVFLIDFGLARLFRDPATYLHRPYVNDLPAIGTLLFTSVNGQQGYTQSRRDDLESLAYTIIYSARGDLPWATTSASKDILQKKKSITVKELCEGLPAPFCKFVDYVRSLDFDEKPDYQYLHSILTQCSETEPDHFRKALPCSTQLADNIDCTPVSCDRV